MLFLLYTYGLHYSLKFGQVILCPSLPDRATWKLSQPGLMAQYVTQVESQPTWISCDKFPVSVSYSSMHWCVVVCTWYPWFICEYGSSIKWIYIMENLLSRRWHSFAGKGGKKKKKERKSNKIEKYCFGFSGLHLHFPTHMTRRLIRLAINRSFTFFPGGWEVPSSGENFVNPPNPAKILSILPSDTCPHFWIKACPPQPRFVPENLKNLNTFLCQIWLLLSSKVP